MAKTLILVRHGDVEGSKPGMLLGRTDLPLSDAGRDQAAAAGSLLVGLAVDRFLCSPLRRARETAEILAGQLFVVSPAVRLEVDANLREMDFGEWEGLSYAEAEEQDPSLAHEWAEFASDFAFPRGDSLEAFAARVVRAAKALAGLEQWTGGGVGKDASTVLAVTHGGVIRALICYFLGISLRNYLLFDVAPGSVVTLRLWQNRGVLTGLWRPGVPTRVPRV
jgi:broad specificity phosphatase PhoE